MEMTTLVKNLGRNDVKLVGRDSFLLIMGSYMFIAALVLRFLLPWANGYLAEQELMPSETIARTLESVYPLIVTYFVHFLGAMLVGTMFGFMLLDEKDDNTLRAMLVTPVPLGDYLKYRLGVPTVIAFASTLAQFYLLGFELVSFGQAVLLSAAASLTAPIVALFYATAAANKVQGFAMSKFTALAGMVIVFGYFASPGTQWFFGLFPPFWVSKAYWLMLEGNALSWVALLMAVITQVVALGFLARLFRRAAYR